MTKETMSSDTRNDLLDVLEKLMQEHPDWRIGQLIANVAFLARQTNSATWDVENEEFVKAARQHLLRMAKRREETAQVKQEAAETRQKATV